jgi:3-phosphoshikimate 1-carboxyvinyltransferase
MTGHGGGGPSPTARSLDLLPDPLPIVPFGGPIDAVVRIPGSKSITNRALLCAALASGPSVIRGTLLADDTEAMRDCIEALGAGVLVDAADNTTLTIDGCGGTWKQGPITVNARMSGTTARFIAPSLMLGTGSYVLDGRESMRERPMGDLVTALVAAGTRVESRNGGRLPITVHASAGSASVEGAEVGDGEPVNWSVPGHVSSQFLSGLLLTAPCLEAGAMITVTGELVSRPYVDMTLSVMRSFGAQIEEPELNVFVVRGTGYTATDFAVEPDASAASYAFAAAAIAGGRVVVRGLGNGSTQGDLRFASILGEMGADVTIDDDQTLVIGGPLRGITVDMADCSDTAQTLAAVAVFATGTTTVNGIGFIRNKETNRVAAVPTELQRCGVQAYEHPDGFVVHPGQPEPTVVQTYRDHRMAMSFALLGLRSPGISIADPGCVAKTFPEYFEMLESLRPHTVL